MSNYNELVAILKELLTNRFYPRPDFTRGLLGDGQGNVLVPNRPDYNYVRFNRSSTETFEVFNKEVSQPVDGWPVLIGSFPWSPGLVQVVATDWSAYSQTGWGDSVASIQAHSPTHEWPNFQPGSDPLNVYMRAITPLRTQSAGTGSASVVVTSYEYDGATGTNYLWPGVPPLDLSAATPPTGSMRYMGVYLNPATNSLGVVTGGVTVYTDALEPDRPVWPRNIFPSAYVRLYGGQSMVQERDIRDARRLFDTSLMFTGTPAALPLPIVTGTFLSGQDGTPGWISYPQATTANAGIVELATTAEVVTGTDTSRAIVPTGLMDRLALKVKNTSGSTVAVGDIGYITEAGEFKYTTTANDLKLWAVVTVGGANNADVYVARTGRWSVAYTGTAPSAGHYLVTSTTGGDAQRQTYVDPAIFAVCMAGGSGGFVDALLLCNRTEITIDSDNNIFSSTSNSGSDFVSVVAAAGVSGDKVYYGAISAGNLASITPDATTELGKLILHNTTRTETAKIIAVGTDGGGTFIQVSSSADIAAWVATNAITVRSQTNTDTTLSRSFYDLEITSTEIPALTVALKINIHQYRDSGATGESIFLHPYETGSSSKRQRYQNAITAAVGAVGQLSLIKLVNRRLTVLWSASGASTATVQLRIRGATVASP